MKINRIVPDLPLSSIEASKRFYGEFLGLSLQMDMGWVATFVSRTNPNAQVTVLKSAASAVLLPAVSIEVDDGSTLYAKALWAGMEIVYPLTDEPWGVIRFFVKDPDGHVINIVSHAVR